MASAPPPTKAYRGEAKTNQSDLSINRLIDPR
jgi:hypothetical protein